MKKTLITLTFLFALGMLSYGQVSDPLISSCAASAGADAKYLKDFRIQLGNTSTQGELRYKANMSLWKSTKYRFSMCNEENSKGQLYLVIKDDGNQLILSTFDKKTGKTYPYVDFECHKSGIYTINYDFTDGQQGSGVGVVSMIK